MWSVAPEIQVQSKHLDELLGQEARFECRIRANPLTNHYWMKDGRVIENSLLSSNEKFHMSPHLIPHTNNAGARTGPHSKHEIIVYNQNSNEYLTVTALLIKVGNTSPFILFK